MPGADPGFFLGGGALVSCSTSTPINHIVFFFAEYQLYKKTAGHLRGGGGRMRTPCTLPLDPSLDANQELASAIRGPLSRKLRIDQCGRSDDSRFAGNVSLQQRPILRSLSNQ